MIKIRIINADHEIDIRFPISENELYAKLAEIHAIEGRDTPQSAFVTDVYWPEEFSMLKDRFANLDELNYLARRMESFDYNEYDQFLIGITTMRGICLLSFAIALFAVVVFQTDLKMVNEDITQVMQLTPDYRGLYAILLLGLIVWDILLVVKSRPIKRCLEFFDLGNQKANEA